MTSAPNAIYLPPCARRAPTSAPTLRHAYFGYMLHALAPQHPKERINAVTLLLTRLHSATSGLPGSSRALELRYVVTPGTADNGWQEDVTCLLLGRASSWSRRAEAACREAQTFARDLHHLLATTLPSCRFVPLDTLPAVVAALDPFPIADIGEVRHQQPEGPEHASAPLPLLGVPDGDAIVEMMLLQEQPTILSVCLEPTTFDAHTVMDLVATDPADHARSSVGALRRMALAGDVLGVDELTRVQEVANAQRWQVQHLAALRRRCFRLRIQLAGAGRLSDALIATLTGEAGGPGCLTAADVWQDPSLPLASGAAWVRPRSTRLPGHSTSELARAQQNLTALAFASWGQDRSSVAELGSLADVGEAARLFALPTNAIWLRERNIALALPFPGGVVEGTRLGVNTMRGVAKPVMLPAASRPYHLWIVGQTGTGKSTLLESLILQDIRAGKGVIAIDPHGDLIQQVLGKIPAARAKDVILFDPADTEYPLGINPLDARTEDEKAVVVSTFIGLLHRLYDPYHQGIVGPRFEHAVRNAMLTVMSTPGGTLVEVLRVLQDPTAHRLYLPHITDPIVKRYWTDQIAHTQDFHRSEVLDYVVSKFGRFVTDYTVRRIVGQSESSFSFRAAMDTSKIVLLSLAKGLVGSENANFLGVVLLPKILQAALSRARLRGEERRDVMLYIDEFQNYATDSLALMLAEARKYHVALTLANQHVGQLTADVRDAVIGNVGSILSFRLGAADAHAMEQVMAPSPVSAQFLSGLPNYTAYGRILAGGQRTPAFTLETELDTQRWSEQRRRAIVAHSRRMYGRKREQVDAAMRERARL